MKIAVCDTSSLIRLQKGNAIHCLEGLFDKIQIPLAVKKECRTAEVAELIKSPFFEIHDVKNILPIGLGLGEREAISLAVENDVEIIITDDEKALSRARQQGLFPLKTIHILKAAKRLKITPAISPYLDLMKSKGEGIEDEVYPET